MASSNAPILLTKEEATSLDIWGWYLAKPGTNGQTVGWYTSAGWCEFPKRERPQQPTQNEWLLGWSRAMKAWVAYSFSKTEKKHRLHRFASKRGMFAFRAKMRGWHWEITNLR